MSGVPELATMSVWEFDVFDIPDKRVLMGVMWRLIDALGVGSDLGVSESSLQGFVQDVAVGYRDNPFHNLHHATCVTHFTYMLINAWDAKKFLSSQQVLAVILSSVAHDVDHPGNANQFEINSQSDMSLMYKGRGSTHIHSHSLYSDTLQPLYPNTPHLLSYPHPPSHHNPTTTVSQLFPCLDATRCLTISLYFPSLVSLYPVQAVLESHHCATMFQILRRAKNNFLLTLPRETCQEVVSSHLLVCLLACLPTLLTFC